jgi:putative transposase
MPNHVHLILLPKKEDSLAVVLRRTHGRYAQYWNARKQRSGHLWQNRFYSCPLGRNHLLNALAYVENNPVRAGLVKAPEKYAWSSAAAHLGRRSFGSLLDKDIWLEIGGIESWRNLLHTEVSEEWQWKLRRATYAGKELSDTRANEVQRTHE